MDKILFTHGLEELGLDITKRQLELFGEYSEKLKEWNEKMNLTAITDDEGISVKHFLDSVLPLKYLDINGSVADIGTGAGFPGLPLKIMRPETDLTLIDSLNKRISFLECVTDVPELKNVKCVHARAEELSKKAPYRDAFDFVVSRAVANMTALCEYCMPYVAVGGYFAALKAGGAEDEINAAKPMIGELGGVIENVIEAPLPCSDITRLIVVVRKNKPTQAAFPRSTKKIKAASGKQKN